MVLIHLGLVLADDEPEPVHGDGDHSQGGHEGRQTGNCACKSGKSDEIVYYLPYIINISLSNMKYLVSPEFYPFQLFIHFQLLDYVI